MPRTFSPRGSFQYTRPVLVLIGRRCASSNESFISAMRELPNVTLAGDTTAGSTANPGTFNLPGGWSYTVSRWIAYTVSGQVIEDQGIQPRIAVPASPGAFMSGRDPVLDWAIAQLSVIPS
jgi:C-terminal processing protease CtpA/Prc